MTVYAAILAGGVGTRLWPRSRQSQPKQFADITGDGQTMIQATMARLDGMVAPDDVYVLTGERYRSLVAQQLTAVPVANAIAEPSGRNTAPAIGLACVYLQRRDPDGVVVILPADHVIAHVDLFQAALQKAVDAAAAGNIVTLGIEPDAPHTGYGYIQRGAVIDGFDHDDLPVYQVERFHEKPDLETAVGFLATGKFFWNGGIFVARVSRLMQEFERQLPEVYALLQAIDAGLDSAAPAGALQEAWAEMPSISIDYGIMEQADNVAVVPLRAGWNDVGSWDALESIIMPDAMGNRSAHTETVAVDSHNNIVYCGEKLVALVGVDDLVVVDTGDALLIGHRSQMQGVRDVVDGLRTRDRADLL
jgi:mannose-1-phosphate guanylyltransferase